MHRPCIINRSWGIKQHTTGELICVGFAELLETGSKRKCNMKKNVSSGIINICHFIIQNYMEFLLEFKTVHEVIYLYT